MRKRVLQCYIDPILLYGCESWTMTKQTSTSIEAMEMWFLRRMLRVSWTEKITNLEILNTASSTRKLISNVKRIQAEFLGHVMRKGKLEHLLTTGKIEGKRSRVRKRIKNTRRYGSLAGKKHCGDVCGCKRSRKVEGHDRLRLQQTRQLKKKKKHSVDCRRNGKWFTCYCFSIDKYIARVDAHVRPVVGHCVHVPLVIVSLSIND